jgi:hypothetical protein
MDWGIGRIVFERGNFRVFVAFHFASATSGVVVKLGALFLIMGAYGLWKLWMGIVYLAHPLSEHKSMPDIDQ